MTMDECGHAGRAGGWREVCASWHFRELRRGLRSVRQRIRRYTLVPEQLAWAQAEGWSVEMERVVKQSPLPIDPLFNSYSQLALGLVPDAEGFCLFDDKLKSRGHGPSLPPAPIAKWLQALGWAGDVDRRAASIAHGDDRWLTAVPLEESDGSLLGVFCICQKRSNAPSQPVRHAAELALRLKPLLDCVHRDLSAARPTHDRVQLLTERTAELEWLFNITTRLKGAGDDRQLLSQLLNAAAERLGCVFAVLAIPDKRLLLECERAGGDPESLKTAWQQTQQHLLAWAQRQHKPLIINSAGRGSNKVSACKILSVPIVRDSGRVLGVLVFFNPASAADFAPRHEFLARHLGRQTVSIIDSQFDLMTGLYSRSGLEQMHASLPAPVGPERSIVYVDIDHMHMVNEIHGFELGDELIVRIAELLAPPLLPAGSIVARLSGDRFAMLFPEADPRRAAAIAAEFQLAAKRLVIGPEQHPIEVSVTCGVAALVEMPQGFARAMAAAELACKTAKSRGRGRVELYACEDSSMMRRHDDAVAVGKLRAALRTDRLQLYAQRIAPLSNPGSPGGYELLLRLREENGDIIAPGPLIAAAQRYQLLPSVDLWVIRRAMEMLGGYREMLKTRALTISINMSGQSLGDEDCIERLKEGLKRANPPPGCVIIEITEQAAVTNFARAHAMIKQLQALGCRFALDDFGTGSNSLSYLKNLQISRLKIDGSFVRDILTNKNSLATVKAVVELAKAMGIDTVAEFVESEAIAQAVRKLGIDYAQGYAYGKPEPFDKLLERLDREESQRQRILFLET
jgi:diguanylate cyclase (GGDEF)-like protein